MLQWVWQWAENQWVWFGYHLLLQHTQDQEETGPRPLMMSLVLMTSGSLEEEQRRMVREREEEQSWEGRG